MSEEEKGGIRTDRRRFSGLLWLSGNLSTVTALSLPGRGDLNEALERV